MSAGHNGQARVCAARLRLAGLLICSACAAACSPALNWREVQLGHLSTLLPCKPDTASRTVALGGQPVQMEMAGCEAGGALFAISRVVARDAAQAATLLGALRQASLAQIDNAVLHPVANSGDALTSYDVRVDGHGPNGAAVQARLKWLQSGLEVYQIAAYAERLQAAETESLISELRIR